MAKLKPCPICGHNAQRVTEKRMGLGQYLDHGVVCSNARCSWHLGWAAYPDTDTAEKAWNERVDQKLYLLERSKELLPCSCGGQPEVFSETYSDRDGSCTVWFVRCPSCQVLLTGGKNCDDIIQRWNYHIKGDNK